MTELEKIAYAKTYIEKLANGINPLTDQPVPDSDSINNVRISRCLFYVSDILRQIAENGGVSQRKTKTAKVQQKADNDHRSAFFGSLPAFVCVSLSYTALIKNKPDCLKSITLSVPLRRSLFADRIPESAQLFPKRKVFAMAVYNQVGTLQAEFPFFIQQCFIHIYGSHLCQE